MAISPLLDETGSSLVYPDSASSTPYTAEADAGDFFDTLLDIINPLQHIPLVSSLYRELTGDEIQPAARVVGGAIFGGPLGFASATANVFVEQASGRDFMEHAVALLTDEPQTPVRAELDEGIKPDVATAALAGTEKSKDVIFSGPGIVPSLARSEITSPKQSVKASSVESMADTTVSDPGATTGTSTNETAGGAQAAGRPGDDHQPAWISDAIQVARQAESARAAGAPRPIGAEQPWVAGAMLEALEKYEALARDRESGDPDRDPPEPASDRS